MPQPSPAEKLAALRAELARQSLAGFLIPRADEHLGEYVPARADRLRWLTGFSGSAGLAAVLGVAVFWAMRRGGAPRARGSKQLKSQKNPTPPTRAARSLNLNFRLKLFVCAPKSRSSSSS